MTPETEISITLTLTEWQTIGNMISELPFRIAAPLLEKINKQFPKSQTENA